MSCATGGRLCLAVVAALWVSSVSGCGGKTSILGERGDWGDAGYDDAGAGGLAGYAENQGGDEDAGEGPQPNRGGSGHGGVSGAGGGGAVAGFSVGGAPSFGGRPQNGGGPSYGGREPRGGQGNGGDPIGPGGWFPGVGGRPSWGGNPMVQGGGPGWGGYFPWGGVPSGGGMGSAPSGGGVGAAPNNGGVGPSGGIPSFGGWIPEAGTPSFGGSGAAGGLPSFGGSGAVGGTPWYGGAPPLLGGGPSFGGYVPSSGGAPPTGGQGGSGATTTCPITWFDDDLPAVASIDTQREVDRLTPTCGSLSGSGDAPFGWVAPYTGTFRFSTAGSNYDTILALYDGSCRGPILACDDDSGGSLNSEITLALTAGQAVIVVVDGYGGGEGIASLRIDSAGPQCPDSTASYQVPFDVAGSTVGRLDRVTPSCGSAQGNPDYTTVFQAPHRGVFAFDTMGSNYDTVLALYDGYCEGSELSCNDDWSSLTSRVELPLDAGQQVTVVVDGFSTGTGAFQLHVTATSLRPCCEPNYESGSCESPAVAQCVCAAAPECCQDTWSEECVELVSGLSCGMCSGCSDTVLTTTQSVSGYTTDQPDRWTVGNCGGRVGSGDFIAQFTAPHAGNWEFNTIGSGYDTVLSILQGVCSGSELRCNDDNAGLQSSIDLWLDAGQTVTVVVDGYGGSEGYFVLNVLDLDEYWSE